ncbi:MAG: hypothetical protein RLW62_20860 [Gammaproteobacteria bacterium]
MIRRLLFLAALLALLPACVLNTQDIRVTDEHKTAVRTVGVVALLPARINVSRLAGSALESNFGHLVVDGWNPERIVAEVLVPRFERQGFATRLVAPDGALAAARDTDWRAPLADSIAAAAVEGAWQAPFATIDGTLAADAATGAALTGQLAGLLRTTIAIAAQEAGL